MATAYAALISLQNNLTLIQNHPRHSFSFEHQQIGSLFESVRFLSNYMKYIDDSHGHTKEAAEALESRIARAAQAAEDVIESHVVDQIRAGSTLAGKTTSRYLLDLQKAIDDMDYVVRKASKVMAMKEIDAEQPTIPAAVEATTSPIPLASDKNKMVGFDDQLLRLMDLLTGVPRSSRVIPIVGMGGIGKTTLATNALKHSYIVQYFDFCLWSTVSPKFSVQKILTQLLSQIKEKTSFLFETCSSVSSVGEGLYKSLFGRRYLIVLDDMWSVEPWDEMKFFFPDTSNGSRIVVTTRQSHVATHLGSLKFNMRFLDEDSSWNLFCGKTFGDEGCPSDLEDIGKRIVKNCGGLPLSIVVVGGWLQNSSRKTEYWEDVANNMNSVLGSGVNEQCLNILSLSYRYLPVHLKPCFLFLGVFPKDQEISVDDLISLWIGEGFIQQYEDISLKAFAYRFTIDLFGRCLISVYESVDSVLKCRVHDVLREMCLKIAKKEEFLSVFNPGEAIIRERRVVMKGKIPEVNDLPKKFHASRSASIVRSLICEGGELSFELKLLRVVNKVDSALGNEIYFQHVNLRYLKVDVLYRSYLPSSISLLWNLQTLIILGAYGSILAPYEIWEMLQLRHIEVHSLSLVDPLPIQGLDQENELVLENLRTLSIVENFRLSEEVCRRIPNIEELQLVYYAYGDGPSSYYCPNNLSCFQKLDILKCYFDRKANWRGFVLSLTFPTSLKQLHLRGCRVGWEEVTMKVGCLPHLRVLELLEDSVSGSEWSPVEGGFPCLKRLYISKCDLIHWNADTFHFPVLEEVYLIALSELEEFPSAVGEILTLSMIFLDDCSVSSSISAMRMVVEQEEQGNEDLHLFVHFKCDEENTLEGFKQRAEEEGLISKNIHIEAYAERV